MGRLPDSQPYHLPIKQRDVDDFGHSLHKPSFSCYKLFYPNRRSALDAFAKELRAWKSRAIGNFRNMKEYLEYKKVI